jgi:hypothetical protein
LRGRAGAPVDPVAEAEAVEAAAPLLEEGDDGVERVEGAHAEARVVAAPETGEVAVAVLSAGGESHHVRAAPRPPATAERHIEGKTDLVEIGNHAGHLRF